ncbi:hypothetical protein Pmani_007562 [Petrolisthes manimaculis]|uniref:Ionotropic glutamate receptor C-terminal domain-containing protein n=1 Tax=Petrolisthes manimaculis TaxID=1843537 RepID=A0AAE1UFJ4_9EUCA|nr:hypothetical protein Pmani_007562 [Petrolisthes manimaculis]
MSRNRTLLKVAVEQWIPWCRIHQQEDGRVTISGPTRTILDLFAQQMDFEQQCTFAHHTTTTTTIFTIQYAELAMGPFTVTERREAACDMSVPVAHDYKGLFMVRPGIQSDMGAFLNPFAPLVWLMILVSMCAVSVAMMSLMWMEANVFTSTTRPQNIVSHSIMWAVQTLSQESSEWLPRRTEGRLLVTTWLLASLVFMSSYSGILTAMLTVPRVTIPIDSISDLVSQSRLPWRFEGGSSMYQYFQDATDELRQQVFKGQEGVFKDCWEDKQAIADGQYVAICDETTMRKAMSWDFSTTGKCHMYIAREKIISVSSAIAFKTNSTYLNKANQM